MRYIIDSIEKNILVLSRAPMARESKDAWSSSRRLTQHSLMLQFYIRYNGGVRC